jgi:hypothetical protein
MTTTTIPAGGLRGERVLEGPLRSARQLGRNHRLRPQPRRIKIPSSVPMVFAPACIGRRVGFATSSKVRRKSGPRSAL